MSKFTLAQKILLICYQGTDRKAVTYCPFSHLTRFLPGGNTASIRSVCQKLLEKGLMDKIEREGKILLAVTDLGRKELTKALFKATSNEDKKWSKKLHLVIISVPEKERDKRQKIRSLLINHNYRLLTPGVWFCPVFNEEFLKQLKEKGLLGYLILVDAANINSYSPKPLRSPKLLNFSQDQTRELIISAYQLDSLQKAYEKYLSESARLQKMIYFDTSGYINLLGLQEFLLQTLANDPFWPDDFLALSDLRKKCSVVWQNLSQKTPLPEKEEKL